MSKSYARIQFLSDILSTAIEQGIGDWAGIDTIETVKDSNDILGWRYEHAIIWEFEDTDSTFKIDMNTIVKGLGILRKRNAERDSALLLANRTNGYDGDFDALDANKIVQFGLFGELVYG